MLKALIPYDETKRERERERERERAKHSSILF